MHSRVVPGCIITTKGLTGTMYVSKRLAGRAHLRGGRFLNRRKRSHEIGSEESVSWGGELTAYAERVYSRFNGRQRFSFLVGCMDWRR